MNKKSRIYIAGHTGLIGSAILKKFKCEGYENLCIAGHQQVDLEKRSIVNRYFKECKPEVVILAAGKVGSITENISKPVSFIERNLRIQLNVFEAAHRHEVKKLLFFGSSCMYPKHCDQPMSETMTLSGQPEITSLSYAISKLAGIQMCKAYNEEYKQCQFLPVIPNSVYGPGDNFNPESGHVLSALISRFHHAKQNGKATVTLWGSGRQRREFLYSNDLADACFFILKNNFAETLSPTNIGVGSDTSILELAQLIKDVVGYTGSIDWDTSKPEGAHQKLLDSKKLNALGWKPSTDLEKGLRETYQWYLKNHPPGH